MKILVKAGKTWPNHQNFSFSQIIFSIVAPLLLIIACCAYFSKSNGSLLSILSAFITPTLTIAFSTVAFYWLTILFKGSQNLKNSFLIALIINIPFMTILAISYFVDSQYIWLGSVYLFYLLWNGAGFLLNIPRHQRFQFMLLSLIMVALFWIIAVFIINILMHLMNV